MSALPDGKLEPDANVTGASSLECSTISIAISLKRIADTLNPVNGQDVGSTLFYMEQRLGPRS